MTIAELPFDKLVVGLKVRSQNINKWMGEISAINIDVLRDEQWISIEWENGNTSCQEHFDLGFVDIIDLS